MTGADVISELIFELDASVEAASGFEGEMQRLAGYARCVPFGKHPSTFHHDIILLKWIADCP